MCSFKKLIYLSFYFYNINFSFCLNIYKKRLEEIEKKFIDNEIKSNIQHFKNNIEEKRGKEEKIPQDIEYINVGDAIITIYNKITQNNKTEDFKYIYESFAKVKLNFSQYDDEYCLIDPILILRSLLFNALKKKKL